MSTAAEFAWLPEDPNAELRSLFESAPLGLAQCQRQGNITALNPAMEQILGGPLRTMRQLRLIDLIHPEDRAEGERLLRELFAGERESFQIDFNPNASNKRSIRWRAWRVRGADGGRDYVLALAESAPLSQETDRIQQGVQQGAQLGKQRGVRAGAPESAPQGVPPGERLEVVGRLTGGVAHDFNNLLTGVLLYCDLLLANPESGQRARQYAEEIRKAGIQATGLIKQLLTLSRPAHNGPQPISLNEIAESMRNLLARLIGENIALKFRLDSGLGLIRMDPTQAQQILLNLVLNGRDALTGGGEITVETSNCNVQVLTAPRFGESRTLLPCALFVVADNGIGMDAATRARLFEAFFTTKSGGQGTGLGLATVHDIVTSNGGLIHVDSAPACGTRVTVLLPLVAAATGSQSTSESTSESASQGNSLDASRDNPQDAQTSQNSSALRSATNEGSAGESSALEFPATEKD